MLSEEAKKLIKKLERLAETKVKLVEYETEEDVITKPVTKPDTDTKPKTTPNPGKRPFRPAPGTSPKPKAVLDLKDEKKKITEAEDIHPELKKMLKDRNHPLAKNPAFPVSANDQEHFEELVANKRFKDVLENLKRYARISGPITSIAQLSGLLMQVLSQVTRIEKQHQQQLIDLAIKLVCAEFNIPEGELEFNAELKSGAGSIDLQDIPDKEVAEHIAEYDEEVSKRRFLNSLIQGAAVKTTYAFHLVANELNAIDPNLIKMYSILASFSEYGYWVTPDAAATAAKQSVSAGKVKVDLEEETPKVNAQAISFPYLVHELTKGVMEVLSAHGLPEDPKAREYVINKADNLDAEHWDLRLGPGFWERFHDMIGDVNEYELKSQLYATIAAMKPGEFNSIMKEIMSGSEKGKRMMQQLAKEVKREMNS
jgi:hypothetical protein